MRPRVTKSDRKLLLSYEFPSRINSSRIYPITAPNDSTVTILGHERGITILWKGGRRWRAQVDPTALQDVDMLDADEPQPEDDDNDSADVYEITGEVDDDTDEIDSDILQEVEIETPSAVLHLAIPNLSSINAIPALLRRKATVALACADGHIAVLQLPLAPPLPQNVRKYATKVQRSALSLQRKGASLASLDIGVTTTAAQSLTRPEAVRLNVASAARTLNIWSILVAGSQLDEENIQNFAPQPLHFPAVRVRFHTSPKSSQILVSDRSGAVRMYDASSDDHTGNRPSSSRSDRTNEEVLEGGRWTMAYHTCFINSPTQLNDAAVAPRKKILDAAWVLSGRAIFILLEDGEWGVWDLTGASKTANTAVEDFVLRGYLGTASASTASHTTEEPKRRGLAKLAPMTPNTRKAKSVNLFTGAPKSFAGPARGGLAVHIFSARPGYTDESIAIWYAGEIYTISSVQAFWQKSTSGSGAGSLYSSSITHVSDVNLHNEDVNSICYYPIQTSSAALGQMNTQRDLLVSTDYHFTVSQSLKSAMPTRQLFQPVVDRSDARDQQKLDAGELDIGGMDRLLDSMADVRPRRVGFAR